MKRENKKTISVIFDNNQLSILEKDADKNGRLLSTHIRYIIQQYIEKEISKGGEFNNSQN